MAAVAAESTGGVVTVALSVANYSWLSTPVTIERRFNGLFPTTYSGCVHSRVVHGQAPGSAAGVEVVVPVLRTLQNLCDKT